MSKNHFKNLPVINLPAIDVGVETGRGLLIRIISQKNQKRLDIFRTKMTDLDRFLLHHCGPRGVNPEIY